MSQIRIVEYNPSWVDEYSDIAEHIRSAISSSATRIDHIGSTAVPNLSAKDVIDIQISVSNLSHESVTDSLESIGYKAIAGASDNLVGIRAGSEQLEKRFLLQPDGQRRTHIHVREEGRINQSYPLVFRDFLRSNDVVREAYQILKIELATRFANDSEAYYAIKDPYMDTVYEAAQLWAAGSGWRPDSNFR